MMAESVWTIQEWVENFSRTDFTVSSRCFTTSKAIIVFLLFEAISYLKMSNFKPKKRKFEPVSTPSRLFLIYDYSPTAMLSCL